MAHALAAQQADGAPQAFATLKEVPHHAVVATVVRLARLLGLSTVDLTPLADVQPDAYILYAQAYYQQQKYAEAKAPILKALSIAKQRKQEPKENWLGERKAVPQIMGILDKEFGRRGQLRLDRVQVGQRVPLDLRQNALDRLQIVAAGFRQADPPRCPVQELDAKSLLDGPHVLCGHGRNPEQPPPG